MRKIKVMHLIHQLGAGGAENGIINLANGINSDRFCTSICTLVGAGAQTYRLDPQRTTLFEIGKCGGNDIRVPIKLFRLFKRWETDIVHTHAWGTLCEGISAAKAARVPVLIHGEHGTMQEKKHNILIQKMFWRLADRILSVSRDHACRLSKTIGFPLEKIDVLVNGVDSHRFGARKEAQEIRAGLNLQQDDIVIGTVGRLVPVKNQKLLIHSFFRLSQKFPEIKLIIAGDGPLKEVLAKMADDLGCLGKIRFLGRRSDVPEIMAAMDIFALTSNSEGMSNTILEAMSSGLPVVATAVGGNTELVVNCETGLLIPSDNVQAMVDAIEILIVHPALRMCMGEAGRTRVETRFSLQSMVSNYERFYLRCFKEKVRTC